jgi:polar amino acid transport system substrate-binding protein
MNKSLWYTLGISLLVAAFMLMRVYRAQDKAAQDKRIIVGISADFPPFTYMQEGELVGLDIDLMRAIGTRLHKEIVFTDMPFGTLLPSLQLGTIQVIASGLTATPERAERVLFTSPYLEKDALIIVSLQAAQLNSTDELQGKTVVVNQGYTADLYISTLPNVQIIRLKSPAEALLALTSGRVAAYITAANAIKPFFEQYAPDMFHGAVIPGTDENASLAISQRYPELQVELEAALQAMKADGSLAALLVKWGMK